MKTRRLLLDLGACLRLAHGARRCPSQGHPRQGPDGGARADGAEAHYAIALASDETLEKRWDRIARFYLTMTVYAV